MPTRHLTTLALSLFVSGLAAQDLYVDASRGNDLNPGTPALPLKSLTAAAGIAGNNQTIWIYPGVYGPAATGEVLPIKFGSTTSQQNLVIHGIGSVVFDCGGAGGTAIHIGPLAAGGRLTGITFTNMSTTDWWAKVIEAGTYKGIGSATGFEVDRCRFENVNRGVVIWENNPPVTGWKVHSNLFRNLTNDGINDFFAGSANRLFNNTFVGNTQIAIISDGATTQIVNNLMVNCRVGIGVSATQVAANLVANDMWNCQINFQGIATPPGNLSVDPQFVNAGLNDFRLKSTSPLIEAGVANVPARGDLDGNAGAIDSDLNGSILPEIGAYETTPLKVSASYASQTLSVNLTNNGGTTIAFGVLAFGFGDGMLQVPGWSPILVDPAKLAVVVSGAFPLQVTVPNLYLPLGQPLVIVGLGYSPLSPGLVPGNQVLLVP